VLPALAGQMARLDPDGRAGYEARAETFAAALDALDSELRATLAPIAGRGVLTAHASMGYLLRRYGLRDLGAIEPAPGKEPTARHLQDIVRRLRDAGAKAVFTEPGQPRRPAEVVAEAAGVAVSELDVEGGRPGRESYADLLRYNARQLVDALR